MNQLQKANGNFLSQIICLECLTSMSISNLNYDCFSQD